MTVGRAVRILVLLMFALCLEMLVVTYLLLEAIRVQSER